MMFTLAICDNNKKNFHLFCYFDLNTQCCSFEIRYPKKVAKNSQVIFLFFSYSRMMLNGEHIKNAEMLSLESKKGKLMTLVQ